MNSELENLGLKAGAICWEIRGPVGNANGSQQSARKGAKIEKQSRYVFETQGEFQKDIAQSVSRRIAVLQPDRAPSKSRKAKPRALRYQKGRKQQEMLKCKNEATKLLTIKDRAWVRSSKRTTNEPISLANEPKIRRLGTGDLELGRGALAALSVAATWFGRGRNTIWGLEEGNALLGGGHQEQSQPSDRGV